MIRGMALRMDWVEAMIPSSGEGRENARAAASGRCFHHTVILPDQEETETRGVAFPPPPPAPGGSHALSG